MGSFGIKEALGEFFAENSIPHMLSGKAVPRTVRTLLVVDEALNAFLIAIAFNINLEEKRV